MRNVLCLITTPLRLCLRLRRKDEKCPMSNYDPSAVLVQIYGMLV
jgi:hypothetical protein